MTKTPTTQDVEVRRDPIADGAIRVDDGRTRHTRESRNRSCRDHHRDRTAGAARRAMALPRLCRRGRRLPPGGLRGMVEDYLREHPDQAFGPSELGKKLGRSGGAVANALVKLVEAGTAVCAQAKPLRYTLAPAERDDQAPPAPSRGTGA